MIRNEGKKAAREDNTSYSLNKTGHAVRKAGRWPKKGENQKKENARQPWGLFTQQTAS